MGYIKNAQKDKPFFAYLTYREDDKVVVLLGMAYKLYGGLAWMQAFFMAFMHQLFASSQTVFKLTTKSIAKLNLRSTNKIDCFGYFLLK